MDRSNRQIFSGRASHNTLGKSIGVLCACAILAAAQHAAAATVPTMPNHLWLLDGLVGPWNNATPDSVGGLKLYGARALGSGVTGANASTVSPKLIGVGDNLPVLPKVGNTFTDYPMDNDNVSDNRDNPVPFQYTGNKSTVVDYGDEFNNPRRPNLTPDTLDLAAMSGGGLHVGTSGAISLWVNPINHSPNGYSYLFDLTDGLGNRLRASGNSYFFDGPEYWGLHVNSYALGVLDGNSLARNPTGPNDPYGLGNGVNWGGNATPASYPGGNWSNLVFTWDPAGMTVYSNGAFLKSSTMVVPEFWATNLNFGSRGDRGNPFAGMFDEIAVWDTKLSADDVQWIYENSLSGLLTPVPEPTSAGLFAMGLIALAALRRRK